MSLSSGSLVLRSLLLFLATLGWKAYAQSGPPDVILLNGRVFTGADSPFFALCQVRALD
jgi:hypothetical protein